MTPAVAIGMCFAVLFGAACGWTGCVLARRWLWRWPLVRLELLHWWVHTYPQDFGAFVRVERQARERQ